MLDIVVAISYEICKGRKAPRHQTRTSYRSKHKKLYFGGQSQEFLVNLGEGANNLNCRVPILFHCFSSVTPIRTKDEQYCAAPGSGGCNPADETIMQWKKGKCDSPEAQFIFDPDTGTITHNCSGKAVCPKGGSTGYGAKIIVSSKCPAMKLGRRFMRTHGLYFFHYFFITKFASSLHFGNVLHDSPSVCLLFCTFFCSISLTSPP